MSIRLRSFLFASTVLAAVGVGAPAPAEAGVGDCTAGYVEQVPGSSNQVGLFFGYVDCVVYDTGVCLTNLDPGLNPQEYATFGSCLVVS